MENRIKNMLSLFLLKFRRLCMNRFVGKGNKGTASEDSKMNIKCEEQKPKGYLSWMENNEEYFNNTHYYRG